MPGIQFRPLPLFLNNRYLTAVAVDEEWKKNRWKEEEEEEEVEEEEEEEEEEEGEEEGEGEEENFFIKDQVQNRYLKNYRADNQFQDWIHFPLIDADSNQISCLMPLMLDH